MQQSSTSIQPRHKIALSFSLLLAVAATAFWLLFQTELQRSLNDYSTILGATLAEQTASSVRELVLVDDLLGLNVELSQLVRNANINFVSVHDVDNNLLASAGQSNPGTSEDAIFTAPIKVQEATAGTLRLHLDLGAIDNARKRLLNIFLLVLGISLVLVVSTAYALAGSLRTRLMNMADQLAAHLDEDFLEDDDDNNEISRLQSVTAGLLATLQDKEEQLLKTGIWQSEHPELEHQAARIGASILVVKVVNANTAIELLHPDTLTSLLQEYHTYLDHAVKLYGGDCYRLSGESVMVCFDSATCGEKHSVNALYSAGLFQTIMSAINEQHRKQGRQVLEFRMAIHSGDVFLAPAIYHPGSGGDAVNGVMGKTIDVAYFLSKQARPHELVISESASSRARKFQGFDIAGQNQVSMPADNMSFMAYILANGFASQMDNIQNQCAHILEMTDY